MLLFFMYCYNMNIYYGGHMNEFLLKQIYNASIRNEVLINKDFISMTVKLFANELNLGEYYKGDEYHQVDEYDRGTAAEYDGDKNIITFYFDSMEKFLSIYEKNCHLPEFDTVLLKNLLIIRAIYHEFGHALEKKTIDDNSSLEAEVLYLYSVALDNLRTEICPHYGELEDEVKNFYDIVDKNYNSDPAERITIIRSTKRILDILFPIKDEVPFLYGYIRNMFFEDLAYGYFIEKKDFTCPTEAFFSNIGQRQVWKLFDFYRDNPEDLINYVNKEYSLSDCLLLGLPVSPRIWRSKRFIREFRNGNILKH